MGEDKSFCKKKLSELSGYTFIIPYYQRGYRWTPDNIQVLLDDLKVFIHDDRNLLDYYLQPLSVSKINKNTEENKKYKVIDGQQRLTTLFIIAAYLFNDINQYCFYKFEYNKDEKITEEDTTFDFLKKLPENVNKDENSFKINQYYMVEAYNTIKNWFETDGNSEYKDKIKDFFIDENERDNKDNKKNIVFLWYEVKPEEEYATFRNINSNKIQLTNSDLIKALLVSDSTGLDNREQIAVQFEQMERQFTDNKFWYMFNNHDVQKRGQSRIDFLFNMYLNTKNKDGRPISEDVYKVEPRTAFFMLSKYNKTDLEKAWEEIRNNYVILTEFFNDSYYYHYIGYLCYIQSENDKHKLIEKCISIYKEKTKDNFKNELIKFIKDSLIWNKGNFIKYSPKERLELISYQKVNDKKDQICEKAEIRKIFLLHNIETILQRYEHLNKRLHGYYEFIPFEIFNTQTWHIEHIDSQTDNKVESPSEKKEWLQSVFEDFRDKNDELKDLFDKSEIYNGTKIDEEFFKDLENNKEEEIIKFEEFKKKFDEYYENHYVDTELSKHGIGNLVLLDQHTNTRYHNSLFIKKRRIIIQSSGLSDNEKQEDYQYILPCTRDIYLKSYNTSSSIQNLYWTKKDSDAYKQDILDKLSKFFKIGETNE